MMIEFEKPSSSAENQLSRPKTMTIEIEEPGFSIVKPCLSKNYDNRIQKNKFIGEKPGFSADR